MNVQYIVFNFHIGRSRKIGNNSRDKQYLHVERVGSHGQEGQQVDDQNHNGGIPTVQISNLIKCNAHIRVKYSLVVSRKNMAQNASPHPPPTPKYD